MSSPNQDDGDELHVKPPTVQQRRISEEDGTATPTQGPVRTPGDPDSFSRSRPQLTPSTDSGQSVPPAESSADPFVDQEESSPGTEETAQVPLPRSPQPAQEPTNTSSEPVAQPASPPTNPIGEARVLTPPLQRSPSPERAGAAQPGGQPATTPGRRYTLNPFGAIRDWLSPPAKTTPEQRQEPWEYGPSTTPFLDEVGESLQFETSLGRETQPSEAGQEGREDSFEGTTLLEEADDTQGTEDEPREDDDGDAKPDAEEAGGNLEFSGVGLVKPLYGTGRSSFPRPGFPLPSSRRGSRRVQDSHDAYNFESEYFVSHVRAKAFANVFQKIEDEGVFQDQRLLDNARHYSKTREPNIGSQALDELYNESTKAMREWLENNSQDFTQKLQDMILDQVARSMGSMKARVRDLLGEEEEYIKATAVNLEELITRPVPRTRSNTSGAASSVASEHNYVEYTAEQLKSLPRKDLVARCMQAQQQVKTLHDACDYLETGNAELEQDVRHLEDANRDLRDTEEVRVHERIQSLVQSIPIERGMPVRDTGSRPSSAGAVRTRTTPTTSTSSGRSPRLPGIASNAGPSSTSASVPAPLSSPTAVETTVHPADDPEDPIREQYISDLEDVYINLRWENELIPTFIRQVAEEAAVPLRPGMEERSERGESEANVPVSTTADTITPEQLLARLHQVTLERDRARRGELEAQEQLRSLQQPENSAPAGLMERFSNALIGGKQPDPTPTVTPSTTAPLTASLNHPTMVRLLRMVSQLAEELSGCSLATSNLAQTMARCGRMNTDQSPVPPALNNLRAVVRTLRGDKPGTPTEPDLAGGSDVWRSLYLDDMEGYMQQVRQNVVVAINTVDDSVVDWGRLNQRGSNPSSARGPASLPTGGASSARSTGRNWAVLANELDQTSSQGGSGGFGSPAGASVSEQILAVNLQPLVGGEWPETHPNYPCDFCKPVLELPAFAAELRDARTAKCTCGTGDVVEVKAEEATKSQGSARSVTFADENPAILASRREKRRPSRLDLSKAGSSAGNEVSDRPSTPHPSKSAGDRGSSSFSRASGRSETSASQARRGCNCNCPCRRGQVQVAYYTCRNMAGQPADEAPSRPQTSSGSQEANDDEFRTDSEAPRSIERWLLDVATDVASIVGWASPRVSRASPGPPAQEPAQIPLPSSRSGSSFRTSPGSPAQGLAQRPLPSSSSRSSFRTAPGSAAQDPSQIPLPSSRSGTSSRTSPGAAVQDPSQIPLPSSRSVSSFRTTTGWTGQDPSQIPLPPSSSGSSPRSSIPSLRSSQQSPRTPSDRPQAQTPQDQTQSSSPRRTPVFPDAPGRRTRRATAPANLGALTRLPRVLEADVEDNNGPTGHNTPAERQSGGGRPSGEDQQPSVRPERSTTNFWVLLINDPLLAILTLLWDVILFFTFNQLRNILRILWFSLSAGWYYVRLGLYVVLRFLARQNVLHPQGPVLPRPEISSLLAWAALVWISAMTIALNEERRIWGSTNAQVSVNYYRGMPYRRLYPWWSMYLVDTDLMGPALGGLSESVHGLIFPSDVGNWTSTFFSE